MFKRGDVYEYDDKSDTFIFDGKNLVSISGGDIEPDISGIVPYTGPTYEKDGRRFVASGEFRAPKIGDWFDDTPIRGGVTKAYMDFETYRPILLPVSELEPEPKFAVGDWVEINGNDRLKDGGRFRIANVDKEIRVDAMFTVVVQPDQLTKLPGRPLTTDDLMQVLSGKKITVECHACGCGSNGSKQAGEIYIQKREQQYHEYVAFYHKNFVAGGGGVIYDHRDIPGETGAYFLARFVNGSIVFAGGVENDIYVVEA